MVVARTWEEGSNGELFLVSWVQSFSLRWWKGSRGFSSGSEVNNLPAKQETWVQSLGQEDPLEKELAPHSSILAWRIPRTEEPEGLAQWGKCTWSRRLVHFKRSYDMCVYLYTKNWKEKHQNIYLLGVIDMVLQAVFGIIDNMVVL